MKYLYHIDRFEAICDKLLKDFERLEKTKNIQIEDQTSKIINYIYDFLFIMQEIKLHNYYNTAYDFMIDQTKYYGLLEKFKKKSKDTESFLDNLTELKDYLEMIRSLLKSIIYSGGFYSLKSNAYKYQTTSYEPVNNDIKNAFNLIKYQERIINVLDFEPDKYQYVYNAIQQGNYHIYMHKDVLENYTNTTMPYKRIAGFPEFCKISNNAFDILVSIINTERLKENIIADSKSISINHIKNKIQSEIKYIHDEGYYIVCMPYFRLYREIALTFSRYFSDIKIIRSEVNDQYIYMVCKKKKDKECNVELFNKLRKLYSIENIEEYINNQSKELFTLPVIEYEITTFRGTAFDYDRMKGIVDTSGCKDDFWNNQLVHKNVINARPLLPFNVGQLGLVLTSGCLDGIIEEDDGSCHLIKGRVTKKTVSEVSQQDSNKVTEETISNRVNINIFTPEGDYIELA